jgi:hypothetical protein
MTSHLPPLRSACSDLGVSLLQNGERLFEEMPSGSGGHDEAQYGNRVGLLAVSGNGLHRKRGATESVALDSGVREETINRNFLHCERLVEGRVVFVGHLTLPCRLHVTKLTRNFVDTPAVYFSTFVPHEGEYSAFIGTCPFPTASFYQFVAAPCVPVGLLNSGGANG